jgi:hypothetical protein
MAERIRLALLALWLGAMLFFSVFVAPAAFAVLPTRRMAGDVVSRTLGGLEYLGLALAALLVVVLLASRARRGKAYFVELGLTLAMLVSTLVARFVVAARLHEIRLQFGDRLDALTATDPVRVSFSTLHQASVALTGFNMIAAFVLIVMLVWRGKARNSPA